MSHDIREQFIHTLERAQSPIIILRHNASIDDFASAITIRTVAKRMQKEIDIVSTGGTLPQALSFLNETKPILGALHQLRRTTIHVDISQTDMHELAHAKQDGILQIHLTPKQGLWKKEDIVVHTETYKHDLIITIGICDLHAIGPLFQQYASFFDDTPIINIDHAPENEHFGQINIVDINSTSCAEVCYELFEHTDNSVIDEHMATCLLAGMMHKTKSFRAQQVTPKTMRIAGQLVAKGAKRDLIVEQLYKTKSVSSLKLWGRALSRVKVNAEKGLIWTMLTKQDFMATDAKPEDLHSIVDDILSSTPNSQIVVILFEIKDHIEAFVYAERPYDALALTTGFSTSGTHEQAHIHIHEENIVQAEQQLITHIETQLSLPTMPL